MAKKTENAIATLDDKYPVISHGGELLAQIRENMAGENLTPQDLQRIKVPSGGSTVWQIMTAAGEESMKEIVGIIVHITRRRAYWQSTVISNDPPNCSSVDCLTGIGDPGGDCIACPHNQFGSALRPDGSAGAGKACKERKLIFILREGNTLPDIVDAPPASLVVMRRWQVSLQSVPYYGIITRLGLTKTTSRDNFDYAQIEPTMIEQLPVEKTAEIRAYAQQLHELFGAVTIEREDTQEV